LRYKILLHPKAAEFLDKADEKIKKRITEALAELRDSPKTKGQQLQDSRFLRLRIGDYRAIYTVNESEKRVIILFIGYRRDVYDDFSRIF